MLNIVGGEEGREGGGEVEKEVKLEDEDSEEVCSPPVWQEEQLGVRIPARKGVRLSISWLQSDK